MGRPRKINEATGTTFRSDRELVDTYQTYNAEYERLLNLKEKKGLGPIQLKKLEFAKATKLKAIYELWDKYFKLRMKMKFELISLARRNSLHMTELIEEYDAYAWNVFITQIDGIELNRVKHLKNWSMYIRIWGYWRSMNRDILKEWFTWTLNTVPIEGIIKNNDKGESESLLTNIDVHTSKDHRYSIENQFDIDVHRKIFWESIDRLKEILTEKQRNILNMKINGTKTFDIVKKMNITNKIYKDQICFIKNQFNVIIKEVAIKHNVDSNFDMLSNALAS